MHRRVKRLVAVSIASASWGCMSRTAPTPAASPARVRPGITVLLDDSIALIRGKRVALLTNQTGIDASDAPTETIYVAVANTTSGLLTPYSTRK